MIKSELINALVDENPHLRQQDIEVIVGTVFEEITKTLENGNRAELRGFGAFSVRERRERLGRNPRTGASVNVGAKKVPFFKAGKELRERVDGKK